MSTLLPILDAALASATARSGAHLVCRPGCTQCCHGVFAISQQDAARLREGLAALTQTDPACAAALRARVASSLARLTPHFPGDHASGVLADDYEASSLFADPEDDSLLPQEIPAARLGDCEPCPALSPATGTCDLYAWRPTLCRTFGPPARTPDGDLTHCELCYTSATTDEIAACELDPALPDLIAASDEAFNTAHHVSGETLVAFALRDQ